MNAKSLAYSEKAAASVHPLQANHSSVARENPEIVDSLLHPLAILIHQVLTRLGRLERKLILIDDEENMIQALESSGSDPHGFQGGVVECLDRSWNYVIQPNLV
jgi:hypothetical protein